MCNIGENNYRIYHDESKVNGYWHGMLLVPEKSRSRLLRLLQKSRKINNYNAPLGIKNNKRKNPRFECAKSWLTIAVCAMQTKLGQEPPIIQYNKNEYEKLKELLAIKFILFREYDNHKRMLLLNKYAEKVETTFRMGLKGGLNFLATDNRPINIIKIHFDGFEHYHRHIDKDRIVKRIYNLKSCCSIIDNDNLIDDRSSNHIREDSQNYDDCQLLQLTDILIGSMRTLLGHKTQDIHNELAFSAKLPLEAYKRGYTGFRNSRWFGSFCMSQCKIINGQWQFSELEILQDCKNKQLELLI